MDIEELAQEFKAMADTDAVMFATAVDGGLEMQWTPRPRKVSGASMEECLTSGIALYKGSYIPPGEDKPVEPPPPPPPPEPERVEIENPNPPPGEGDGLTPIV